MPVVSGHAYPWDVIGDPGFVVRVQSYGIGSITLAAAYHTVRAATPMHPRHRLVEASTAALYRPIRPEIWRDRRLTPASASAYGSDAFATASRTLTDAGLAVNAWIVLTHNSRLGRQFPDIAVTNCFDESYSYALCPTHAEVRSYAATLAAEAVADTPVTGVSIEACGQLGAVHGSHHDKTDGAYGPVAIRALSVCCCRACRAAWRTRGLDPAEALVALRAAATQDQELAPELAAGLLSARHAATDALRAEVLDAVRATVPHTITTTLHASPDPWATGASPGLTPTAASDVDAILIPAWPTGPTDPSPVARAREVVGPGTDIEAYVTVLSPEPLDAVVDHVRRLVADGATGIGAYHLGLAPPARQSLFPQIVAACSGGTP